MYLSAALNAVALVALLAEQQGRFFDVMEFFPTLTKELPAIPR
jgi:hypothetical protein